MSWLKITAHNGVKLELTNMCVLSYNRKRVQNNFLTCFKQSQNSSEVLTGELPSHWFYNFMKLRRF